MVRGRVSSYGFGNRFEIPSFNELKTTQTNVHCNLAGAYALSSKMEALPLKGEIGGYRILFSHNLQFDLSKMARYR